MLRLGCDGVKEAWFVFSHSIDYTISVTIMVWTGSHWSFAVQAYYENNYSVIAVQQTFHRQFVILFNNNFPDANTISSWVKRLEDTGNTHGEREKQNSWADL